MVLLDNDGVCKNNGVPRFSYNYIFILQFLSGLTKLFTLTKNSGTVFLTMKKCESIIYFHCYQHPHFTFPDNGQKKQPRGGFKKRPKGSEKDHKRHQSRAESPEPEENLCLLRATNGKKKLSTVVSAKEVTRFQLVKRIRASIRDTKG